MADLLPQFLLTIAGGAIGSGITMWLGSHQFRSQRWWEKKAEAYSAIINAFHAILDEDSAHEEEMLEGTPVLEKEELRKRASAAEMELWRQMRLSSFLISNDVEIVLRKMFDRIREADAERDWNYYVMQRSSATFDAFKKIKKIAERDLGTRPWRLWN